MTKELYAAWQHYWMAVAYAQRAWLLNFTDADEENVIVLCAHHHRMAGGKHGK